MRTYLVEGQFNALSVVEEEDPDRDSDLNEDEELVQRIILLKGAYNEKEETPPGQDG